MENTLLRPECETTIYAQDEVGAKVTNTEIIASGEGWWKLLVEVTVTKPDFKKKRTEERH